MAGRHFKQRSALEANQEKRGGRVLKAFRKVDSDDASLIGGALRELEASKDIPAIKVALGYNAYVFDPRLMDKNVNPALIAGFKIGQFVARLERSDAIEETGYASPIGRVHLLPHNRRTVLLDLTSERLAAERSGFYRLLAEQGVAGISPQGRRSGHRDEVAAIAIGTFMEQVSKANEQEFMETIDTALAVNLGPTDAPEVGLGNLDLRTYDPKHH